MTDIDKLTQEVVDHLAGRPVKIVWRDPPSESAAGQCVKSMSGDLTIYIGYLNSPEARLKTLLHETAHAREDYDFIPRTGERSAGSVRRSPEARKVWIADPKEKRAKRWAAAWFDYAERNCHMYWRVDRTKMECRLMALLDWKEN